MARSSGANETHMAQTLAAAVSAVRLCPSVAVRLCVDRGASTCVAILPLNLLSSQASIGSYSLDPRAGLSRHDHAQVKETFG
jgi:hypothetical protein